MDFFESQPTIGIIVLAVLIVVGCTLCCACCGRLKKCCCGSKTKARKGPSSAKYKVAISPFFNEFPIQMPKQRTDLTAPVRFSRMEYAKIQSVGTFYYKGSNLVFAVKGEKGKQPSPATGDVEQGFRRRRSVVAPEETSRTPTSKTVTVQANRVLGEPDPDLLPDSKAVYYEIGIEFLGLTRGAKADGYRPVRSHVAVGWATTPFPPFESVGKANFSLALDTDGRVVSSRPNVLAEDTILYPDGLSEGDVVGCGYELRRDAGAIEFFFTVNGTRLPPLPNDWGLFDLGKARRFFKAGASNADSNVMRNKGRRASIGGERVKLGDHLLAGGAAYPTISVVEKEHKDVDMFVVRVCGQIWPFSESRKKRYREPQYARDASLLTNWCGCITRQGRGTDGAQSAATRLAAKRRRASMVEELGGEAPTPKRKGRRHSTVVASGMERWSAFEHAAAATDAQKKANKQATAQDKKPKWSMGGKPGTDSDTDSEEAPSVPTKKRRQSIVQTMQAQMTPQKWRRRLSAPGVIVGNTVKGWAERNAQLKVTRRAPLTAKLAQVIASTVKGVVDDHKEDERLRRESMVGGDASGGRGTSSLAAAAAEARRQYEAERRARKSKKQRRASKSRPPPQSIQDDLRASLSDPSSRQPGPRTPARRRSSVAKTPVRKSKQRRSSTAGKPVEETKSAPAPSFSTPGGPTIDVGKKKRRKSLAETMPRRAARRSSTSAVPSKKAQAKKRGGHRRMSMDHPALHANTPTARKKLPALN